MKITDPDMLRKMNRALQSCDSLYTLDDIEAGLLTGDLQGHVEGKTWVITQIHQWPQRKAVNLMYIVGNMDEIMLLEPKVEKWAKEMGADLLTAVGRDGWIKYPGWKKIGNLFSKDI